jgi:hypothetical protein
METNIYGIGDIAIRFEELIGKELFERRGMEDNTYLAGIYSSYPEVRTSLLIALCIKFQLKGDENFHEFIEMVDKLKGQLNEPNASIIKECIDLFSNKKIID